MTIEESKEAVSIATEYAGQMCDVRNRDTSLKCIERDGKYWTVTLDTHARHVDNACFEFRIDMEKKEVLSMKDVTPPEPTVQHHHHAAPYVPRPIPRPQRPDPFRPRMPS